MTKLFGTLITYTQKLVQYLQNYLQQVYNTITSGSISVATPTVFPYTIGPTDQFVVINGVVTAYLPQSLGLGRYILVGQAGLGAGRVAPAPGTSDTIDGSASAFILSTQFSSKGFVDYVIGNWITVG